MTERERLIELIKKGFFTESIYETLCTNKRKASEYLADYLLKNGVNVTACATCDYIKYTKEKGMLIELMGKPIKYCPECGEKLE